MSKGLVVLLTAALVSLVVGVGEAATSTSTAILSGPLAKIDIKDAEIETVRGTPKGKLRVTQHYALDPGWLDPREHQASATQVVYDYLVHDAMVKPMPQGLHTYSLAEHAETTADFAKAAFRLRQGLKFHDGHPLTTKEEYYIVPIYINSFVHAVGPRVLPTGDEFHRYWDTPQAGYPVP